MATFLDVGLLGQASIVFSWVLVFVVTFGIAEAVNLLKMRQLNALFAFAVAVVTISSTTLQEVINTLTPWFVILGFFFLFLLLLANFMGMETATVLESMGGKSAAWWILVPFFIVLLIGLSSSLGQSLLEQRTGEQVTVVDADGNTVEVGATPHQESVILTLTNPKVLGMILVLLIAMFTLIFMTGVPGK